MISKHTVKGIQLSAKRISLLLTVIALLLWSYSILYARFEVGYFGLIHGLPFTFFIALAFLTAASATLWTSPQGHGKLLYLQLLVLISVLWLVPEITGGSSPFTDHAYRSVGLVEYIAGQGHFSAASYLSWPGAYVLSTIAAEVLSVDFENMLRFFPLFIQLSYFPPLYVFLNNTLGQDRSKYCWVGAWLFYVANWTGHEYFGSAPGIGLFLMLFVLALITTPSMWEKGTKGFALLLLIVCIFATLVITHLQLALAALCIMAVLGVLNLLKRNKKIALTTVVCFLILLAWNLTGALAHTERTISTLDIMLPGETVEQPTEIIEVPGETVEQPTEIIEVPGETVEQPTEIIEVPGETVEQPTEIIEVPGETVEQPTEIMEVPSKAPIVGGRTIVLSPFVFVKTQIAGHLSGSQSHIAVGKIRILFSAMFVMMGIIGVVLACLTKDRRNITITILVMGLAPLVLLVVPYAGRMIDRVYLISLIPMAYFGARLLDMKKRVVVPILCLFLVVAFPLHIIAHYGNQAYDYLPQSQVSGLVFSYDKTPDTRMTIFSLDQPRYPIITLDKLQWKDHIVLPRGGFKGDGPCWLYIHRQHEAFYDFICGDPVFAKQIRKVLNNTTNINLIYSNPDFELYYLSPVILPQ